MAPKQQASILDAFKPTSKASSPLAVSATGAEPRAETSSKKRAASKKVTTTIDLVSDDDSSAHSESSHNEEEDDEEEVWTPKKAKKTTSPSKSVTKAASSKPPKPAPVKEVKKRAEAAPVPDADVTPLSQTDLFSQEDASSQQDASASQQTPKAPKIIPSKLALTFAGSSLNANSYWLEGGHPELDLTGDTGAVGRFMCDARTQSVTLDLKGYMFKGGLHQCNSFLVVNLGAGGPDAKVEHVVNRFFAVDCVGSAMDAETVFEGQVDFEEAGDDNRVEFQSSEDMVKKTPAKSKSKPTKSSRAGKTKKASAPKKQK